MVLCAGVKLVACLDIGTSSSRYAWSFLDHKDESPQAPGTWETKSSLLLTKDGKFVAYGEEAEDQFIETRDADDGPILIRGFKKHLYNNPTITKSTTVTDVSGRYAVPMLKVLTMSIWHLKNHLMRSLNSRLNSRGATYSENDVHFVLTAPSIWNNKAKAMLRLAATQADITPERLTSTLNVRPYSVKASTEHNEYIDYRSWFCTKADITPERLTIALDAECASIFCQTLESGMPHNLKRQGAQYAIVDIGGGTADIAVHQSVGDGSILSLHHPVGGNWGGSDVDTCFRSYLSLVFGPAAVDEFAARNTTDYLTLLNEFETKRLNPTSNKVSITIPRSLMSVTRQKSGFKTDADLRKHIALANICQLLGDELIVELESLKKMFDYSVNSLVDELTSVLNRDLKNVKDIIVIGEFAKSLIVQEGLTRMLSDHNVVFPIRCDLAVAKGALIFAKKNELVRTRVIKLTYGIRRTEPYDEAKHKGGDVDVINGVKMCTNVFHVLIKGGTTVKTKYVLEEEDKPLTADLQEQVFEIYTSGKSDGVPKLTSDETVNKESEFSVPLPYGCLIEDKKFEMTCTLGATEISFKISFEKREKELFTRYLILQ